jgi:hypothetical protein
MRTTFIALAFAAAACGGSSGGSGANPSPEAMNALSQDISAAATAYGTKANGMPDATACTADETSYDDQVRPMVDQMQGMAPGMDQRMGSMGNGGDADMTCAANAMMAELDRHKGVACSSTTDMGPNKLEAQQHVSDMTHWADHQMVRSDEMGSTMGTGMGGMGGGGMTTGHCVRNGDGTYSMH